MRIPTGSSQELGPLDCKRVAIDTRCQRVKIKIVIKNDNASAYEAELYTAIRNLALPPREALELQPEDKSCPDHLAFNFDEQYTRYMDRMTCLPEAAQLLSLQELDSALNAISGPENSELWTNAAFINDRQWDKIRSLAENVLLEFGW
jgi:hypothetical protein